MTVGKSIGGGIPVAAYGLTTELAERVESRDDLDLVDVGGVGGTLAGNALSVAACRATLEQVLTDDVWPGMTSLAEAWAEGVRSVIKEHRLPWSVQQLGARAEYRFTNPAPRTGSQAHAATDSELDDYLHVYLANHDVLMTPFHNMALMCPRTTTADIELHREVFTAAVTQLIA